MGWDLCFHTIYNVYPPHVVTYHVIAWYQSCVGMTTGTRALTTKDAGADVSA